MLSESEHNLAIGDNKREPPPARRARKGVPVSPTLPMTPAPKVYDRRQRQQDQLAPVGIDVAAQETLDYIGEYLDVQYNVVGNDGGRFHVDIVLTNSGSRMIPSCCWAIYLYHMKYERDLQ